MKYLEFFIFTFFSEIQSIPQGFEVEFLAQSKCQDKMEKTGFTCTNGNFEKSTCLKNDSAYMPKNSDFRFEPSPPCVQNLEPREFFSPSRSDLARCAPSSVAVYYHFWLRPPAGSPTVAKNRKLTLTATGTGLNTENTGLNHWISLN